MVPSSASPKALSEHPDERGLRNATKLSRNGPGTSLSAFQRVWWAGVISVMVDMKRLGYCVPPL